tara:strand:- start:2248 stop:2685 length:438 start_codon:yes stop_codon:yes gene_type:complete
MKNPLTDKKEFKRWQDAILEPPDWILKKEKDMTVKVELSEPYMGKHDERKNVFVKLVDKKASAKYGTVYVVQDKDGRKGMFFNFTYKQIEPRIKDIELNDCFLMTATCKHSQSSYDGQEQTYFNRVKILKNTGSVEKPNVYENGL